MDDDQVIADGIEAVTVDPVQSGIASRCRTQFLVEDPVTKPLAGLDLGSTHCLPEDQIAAPGGNVSRLWQGSVTPRALFATGTRNWKVASV